MALVLTRKLEEETVFVLTKETLEALAKEATDRRPFVITSRILEVRSGQVKTGHKADPRIGVHRMEIWERIMDEQGLTPFEVSD